MADNRSNAGSDVNRIPGVTLDASGFIHTRPMARIIRLPMKACPLTRQKNCNAES